MSIRKIRSSKCSRKKYGSGKDRLGNKRLFKYKQCWEAFGGGVKADVGFLLAFAKCRQRSHRVFRNQIHYDPQGLARRSASSATGNPAVTAQEERDAGPRRVSRTWGSCTGSHRRDRMAKPRKDERSTTHLQKQKQPITNLNHNLQPPS